MLGALSTCISFDKGPTPIVRREPDLDMVEAGDLGPEVRLLGLQSPSSASPTMCLGVSDSLCLRFLISNMGQVAESV